MCAVWTPHARLVASESITYLRVQLYKGLYAFRLAAKTGMRCMHTHRQYTMHAHRQYTMHTHRQCMICTIGPHAQYECTLE